MKEIKAYIRPGFLEPVISQLEEAGVRDLTVIRVDTFAAMVDPLEEEHRILRKYSQKYGAVVKLEIVCRDEDARRFADIIRERATTGAQGDGRVFISDVEAAFNIRTGAEGEDAL